MPSAADATSGEGHASQHAIASNTPSPESPPDEPVDPVLARGRELFIAQCAICHGESGDGQGKFAYLMNPRPRNFLKGNFKLASTQNQILNGSAATSGVAMPGSVSMANDVFTSFVR